MLPVVIDSLESILTPTKQIIHNYLMLLSANGKRLEGVSPLATQTGSEKPMGAFRPALFITALASERISAPAALNSSSEISEAVPAPASHPEPRWPALFLLLVEGFQADTLSN